MNQKSTLRPSPTAILNPRCDVTFKGIFTQGTKESNLALKDFIGAMIQKEVKDLVLQPNEPPADTSSDMQMTFVVSVEFNDGEKADIEIQNRSEDYDFGERAEIQSARLLNTSAKKGRSWNIEKVYQISVLNFEYNKDDNKTVSWYTMRDEDGGSLSDRLNIIFLDLVKVRKLFGKKNLTKAEKWGMFFSYADDEKKQDYLKEIIKEEKGIMAAEFTVSYMSEEDANWFRENSRFIGQRDYNSGMEAATRRGVEQGLQQGLKQGIQQGLKQGIRQAALMMIKNNLPDEQIAKYTGLSEKEIEELRKKQ